MRRKLSVVLLFLCLCFFHFQPKAQSSTTTLDVVSWNVEWFGASFENPADDLLQENHVKKILRYLDADIYGLVEVVDTLRLRRVTDSLGSQFAYVISPYCSNNTTGTGNSWLNGQKLAFIYNKNIFTNVSARGLMRSSVSAYTNFASGRFPFMLSATVTVNGMSRNMNFILLHGKSGSTTTDYTRRREGALELKDTLDTYFSTSLNFILGDFNDALNHTICSGCGTSVSSYEPIVADSIDSDHYRSITMPLANLGQTTMTNFPNVIDNHVISNEMEIFYIPGSVSIRTDVTSQVQDYDLTTSDHYPVFSKYNLTATALTQVSPSFLKISTRPNPFHKEICIRIEKPMKDLTIQLRDMNGKILRSDFHSFLSPGTELRIDPGNISSGAYFLYLSTGNYTSTIKLIHL